MVLSSEATITIHPSRNTLSRWVDLLTTEQDIWYWDDQPVDFDLTGCEVLPRQVYLKHPVYSGIHYVNAYWHWRMPKTVSRLIVSEPGWIERLPVSDRESVVSKQVELDRGLIVPTSHFDEIPASLEPYVVDEKIVVSRSVWKSLGHAEQFIALQREMRLWDDVECFPVPDHVADHIRAIANAYGDAHGSNCLGTTAYCITINARHRDTWMHQPEFIDVLASAGYDAIESTEPLAGDVLVFLDAEDEIVHAVYCLGDDRFLNKNGQSMFNPVQVVNQSMLESDWHTFEWVVYRQHDHQGSTGL